MTSPTTPAAPLDRAPDRAVVLGELAAAAGLGVDEVTAEEDFLGLGIDSIALMRLVDGWRARGLDVRFPDLAVCASVGEAVDVVCSAAPSAGPTTA